MENRNDRRKSEKKEQFFKVSERILIDRSERTSRYRFLWIFDET